MRYKLREHLLLDQPITDRNNMGAQSRPIWKFLLVACLTILPAMLDGSVRAEPSGEITLAPVLHEGGPNVIPDEFLVVFKPATSLEALREAQNTATRLGGTVGHTYTSALIGFSVKITRGAIEPLRAIPGVAYIEANQRASVQTIEYLPSTILGSAMGLDRIDRRFLPLNGTYTYSETGKGVNVYVIDSGIRVSHQEFGGRASLGINFVNDNWGATWGANDCHGHGTNVAGIIGGATYGVAKEVTLYSVRIADCAGNLDASSVVAAVNWVSAQKNITGTPSVANMSLGVPPTSTAVDDAVTNSINNYGVIYTVSAGNFGANACNYSPARVPVAITVGAVDPRNDTRAPFSDFGTCVDLFAPGVEIVSAGIFILDNIGQPIIINGQKQLSDTDISVFSGTSQAAPHVAGVAARWLQNHKSAGPTDVLNAILWDTNQYGITSYIDQNGNKILWPGIGNPGIGSPNNLLHYGSLHDGFDDGDPHVTTADGVHYDFQSAGEFVALRDGNGLEIQTRQTAVSTTSALPDTYTGLPVCVSINTAVAARVGKYRVTYQPLSGGPDLQLSVDGVPTPLGPQGINLGPDGRIKKAEGEGSSVEIDFPDGSVIIMTPAWWAAQNKWLINLRVYRSRAADGIMGAVARDSWLPSLPDSTSLGPMPPTLHQRYIDLYKTFADRWRVTPATSLFDYAPGTSTATFTLDSWPPENPPCVAPGSPPATSLNEETAQNLCRAVNDKFKNSNCVFDVMVTGEPAFANAYLASERIEVASTQTTLDGDKDSSKSGDVVTFTASVTPIALSVTNVPNGTVQFIVDGSDFDKPIQLDAEGTAQLKTALLSVGDHRVAARYIPTKSVGFSPSQSFVKSHSVVP